MRFKLKHLPSYICKVPSKLRLCYTILVEPYFKSIPPGHFYSALPDMTEVSRRSGTIFGQLPVRLPGLNLNESRQRELLETFKNYYSFLPFERSENPESRFYRPNGSFPFQDAFSLYAMIRQMKPKRIIEVGCGASSCVILDTCEALKIDSQITFIEPYPELLLKLIRTEDRSRHQIKGEFIQDVSLDTFTSLEPNDILFIDTSHVSKVGSDVNFIFFEILPILNKGVIVHFHDVFYPFEYPKNWIFDGMFWNEAYLLRAFLMFNRDFEILMFNSYLNYAFPNDIKTYFPLSMEDPGGSLWLRRTA